MNFEFFDPGPTVNPVFGRSPLMRVQSQSLHPRVHMRLKRISTCLVHCIQSYVTHLFYLITLELTELEIHNFEDVVVALYNLKAYMVEETGESRKRRT